MAFKQTKENGIVKDCVLPATGGMVKGALRLTTTRYSRQFLQVTGLGCGRPMRVGG
jgi:hypothetical protein